LETWISSLHVLQTQSGFDHYGHVVRYASTDVTIEVDISEEETIASLGRLLQQHID
jgi:hypothetical protein